MNDGVTSSVMGSIVSVKAVESSSVVVISVANVVVSGSSGSVIGAVQVSVETSSVKVASVMNWVVSSGSVDISSVAYTSMVDNSGSIVGCCVVSSESVGISLVAYTSVVTGTVGDSVDDVAGISVDIDIGCSVNEVVSDDIVVTFNVDDVDDEKLSVVRDVVGDAVDFVIGDCVDAAVDCSVDDIVTVDVDDAEVPVVTLIVDEDTSAIVLSSVVVCVADGADVGLNVDESFLGSFSVVVDLKVDITVCESVDDGMSVIGDVVDAGSVVVSSSSQPP